MRKIFTLLIVAILATATSWAAEKSIVINTANSGVTGHTQTKRLMLMESLLVLTNG